MGSTLRLGLTCCATYRVEKDICTGDVFLYDRAVQHHRFLLEKKSTSIYVFRVDRAKRMHVVSSSFTQFFSSASLCSTTVQRNLAARAMFGSIAGFILASTYVTDSLLFAFPVDCFCLTHDVGIHYFLALRTTYCIVCLLYTSPSPRDLSTSRMPSSA